MKEEQNQFLRLLGQVPARLTAEQTAWLLNCQPHDIPVLLAARLLKPLGNSTPNSVKYFAALEVKELTNDRTWLSKKSPTPSTSIGRGRMRRKETTRKKQLRLEIFHRFERVVADIEYPWSSHIFDYRCVGLPKVSNFR